MRCPIDGSALVITDRSGVEIDYCPQCRGVWLDRGELDKIIDRSASYSAPPPPPQHSRDDRSDHGYRKKKKRGGFLDELFDF
ncbi:zf-TFIIB domain-containing protein [Ruegeria sp. 2205SS24-7]|uniref:TFIIB-type zinc ribbon-containing protein n=1 Tax=Ruegeria discodermiae TaxID=3064389 RepID=UPI00274042E5|nr:zf-TFIIB domain-containing protein [Ruegeria sp. 2205SS24-7]MDP5219320.1 zf-TFIIB domain-containing protein [Ruegeria sp. 2205SS24-7]